MPRPERVRTTAMEAAARSVKRTCYAGLDSVSLRQEVAQRLTSVIPCDAWALCTADPDTGLLTHMVADGGSEAGGERFLTQVYPHHEAVHFQGLTRTGDGIATFRAAAGSSAFHSVAFAEWLRDEGLGEEIRGGLGEDGELWGTLCLLRAAGGPGFTDGETELVRRVAPHLRRGLRMAALLGAPEPEEEERARPAPAAFVVDRQWNLELRTTAAAGMLEELGGGQGGSLRGLPVPVVVLLERLKRAHERQDSSSDAGPLEVSLDIQGHSGRWYRLWASLSEPDEEGDSKAVMVAEPLDRGGLAPAFARLYGLTAREREVVALVARGESTKRIARRLGISPYTVQDHLDHACEKVGVRGRRQLVARLFFDAYAEGLRG